MGVVGASARIRDVCNQTKRKRSWGRVQPKLAARLSQSPCAILDKVFAEQGATRTTSAHRRSSMCKIGSPMLKVPSRSQLLRLLRCRFGVAYRPLIFVRPYSCASMFHVLFLEKSKGRFGCDDLDAHVVILLRWNSLTP